MIPDLYEKYNTGPFNELSELNPLNFILRKAELGKNLTDLEWNWLDKHQLACTIDIIKEQENYRSILRKEIYGELIKLKNKTDVSSSIISISSLDSEIPLALYKVSVKERLSQRELSIVGERYHKQLDFEEKTQKYGITDELPFDNTSENILSKLDNKRSLSSTDIEWIRNSNAC